MTKIWVHKNVRFLKVKEILYLKKMCSHLKNNSDRYASLKGNDMKQSNFYQKTWGKDWSFKIYFIYKNVLIMKHSFDLFVFLNRSKYVHYCSINRPKSFLGSIQALNITIYLRKQSWKVIPSSGKENRTFSPCLVSWKSLLLTSSLLTALWEKESYRNEEGGSKPPRFAWV